MKRVGWLAAGYDSTGVTDVNGIVRESDVRRSPDYLPDLIEQQVKAGATAISIEAFVGILADGLFDRVEVDIAVSTGFERDHLDVHGSIDAYWGAKLSLFDQYLRPEGMAIVATDSAQGELVRKVIRRRGIRLVSVGKGGDVQLIDPEEVSGRIRARLQVDSGSHDVWLPTVHAADCTNLLLAAAAVMGAGASPEVVARELEHVVRPAGRLEVVCEGGGVTAMVDTAHNPGALRVALHAVRKRTAGRLFLVFGAGGERDRGKRSEMGAVALQLADIVILTDDNPRREPPDVIRREVRQGVPDSIEIPRRKDAIVAALAMARPGDVVLVAGRGDEQHQLVGTRSLPLDDREVIREAMPHG